MRALRASVDEVMTGPLRPLSGRAARDSDVPGPYDCDGVVAAIDTLRLSKGRENPMRSVPRPWASGVEALNGAGLATLKDLEALDTNRFVGALAKGLGSPSRGGHEDCTAAQAVPPAGTAAKSLR